MKHFGLLGEKLGHSLSPMIHQEVFHALEIQWHYDLIELTREQLPQVFDYMKQRDITGFNVTIPYKEDLYHMVDILDEASKQIGAINTVHIQDGVTYGYNTDYIGAVRMLTREGYDLKGKDVVILGSGGSCKALIFGYLREGVNRLTVAARNEVALQELVERFPEIHTISLDHISNISADLIVNTTPLGMFPKVGVSPVEAIHLPRFKTAADIVYNPMHTQFLKDATMAGLDIIPGIMMLIEQAIAAEEIWLGREIEVPMERILDAISL